MAGIDMRAARSTSVARPAPGRAGDPAIVALCEAVNRAMRPEPKPLPIAV